MPIAPGLAPEVVGSKTTEATRPTRPIPQFLIDEARLTKPEAFDAQRHLDFQPPQNILTMQDISLGGRGISPSAVTEPFSLFTKDAIDQMRREIFSQSVLADCQFESTFCKNMIRGMGPAWVHLVTLISYKQLTTYPPNTVAHLLRMPHGTRQS